MYCTFNRDKIAFFCGIAILVVLISGAQAINLEPIERLDRLILEWFATNRTAGVDQFFLYISWAGSIVILLPVIVTQLFMLITARKTRDALFLAGSCVGGSLLGSAAKLVFMRPRPDLFPSLIELPTGFSFPSSHALQVTVFVLAELLLLDVSTRPRRFFLFTMAGGILILLVCISRVYLQVHYPTDVVTGCMTGLFWVVGLAAVMRSGHNKRVFIGGRRFDKG